MKKRILVLTLLLCLSVSLLIGSQAFASGLTLIEDIGEDTAADAGEAYEDAFPEATPDPNLPTVRTVALVNDEAGLLSAADAAALTEKLVALSDKHDMAVAVLTVKSLQGKTPQDYADDYFDYNGIASGRANGGILFLIAMESRDWHISTFGRAIDVFTDYGIKAIGKSVVPDLGDGNYYKAFSRFADLADEYIAEADNGQAYDTNNEYKEPYKVLSLKRLIADIAAGVAAAFVPVSSMKAGMNSVASVNTARNYVKRNSLRLYRSDERAAGSRISRVPIQQVRVPSSPSRPSGGGGSSVHISSSGHTHGGGGGKF